MVPVGLPMSGESVERSGQTYLKPICCDNQGVDEEELSFEPLGNSFGLLISWSAMKAQLASLNVMSIYKIAQIGYNQGGQVHLIEVHCDLVSSRLSPFLLTTLLQ